MWADYSTDQKRFTGNMFNIKLEEKSYKMNFKALPVQMQQSKNRQGAGGHNIKMEYQKSMKLLKPATKIIGKTTIWATSCYYPLSPFNNIKKQWAKLASVPKEKERWGSMHVVSNSLYPF